MSEPNKKETTAGKTKGNESEEESHFAAVEKK